MLTIQEIRELIKLVDQSSIEEFIYEEGNSKLHLKKQSTSQPQLPNVNVQTVQAPTVQQDPVQTPSNLNQSTVDIVEEAKENLLQITSPMVGTFYQAPSPDSPPYVSVGSKVKKDTIVCIIEAMKLFNEIEAEVSGKIVEILVENGELVEYGQPLFRVKTK